MEEMVFSVNDLDEAVRASLEEPAPLAAERLRRTTFWATCLRQNLADRHDRNKQLRRAARHWASVAIAELRFLARKHPKHYGPAHYGQQAINT